MKFVRYSVGGRFKHECSLSNCFSDGWDGEEILFRMFELICWRVLKSMDIGTVFQQHSMRVESFKLLPWLWEASQASDRSSHQRSLVSPSSVSWNQTHLNIQFVTVHPSSFGESLQLLELPLSLLAALSTCLFGLVCQRSPAPLFPGQLVQIFQALSAGSFTSLSTASPELDQLIRSHAMEV